MWKREFRRPEETSGAVVPAAEGGLAAHVLPVELVRRGTARPVSVRPWDATARACR